MTTSLEKIWFRDKANNWTSLRDLIYPVGSAYIGFDNTAPGSKIGGTWERPGGGRFLVASGSDIGGSDNAQTGGSNSILHSHGSENLFVPFDWSNPTVTLGRAAVWQNGERVARRTMAQMQNMLHRADFLHYWHFTSWVEDESGDGIMPGLEKSNATPVVGTTDAATVSIVPVYYKINLWKRTH